MDDVGMLNISSADGVMTRSVIGNTGILKTTPWQPSPVKFLSKPLNRYAFPEPSSFVPQEPVKWQQVKSWELSKVLRRFWALVILWILDAIYQDDNISLLVERGGLREGVTV